MPAGVGPLELADIHLETLAWVKLLGKPAPEIGAIDHDGKPVNVAGFRGKVVVLMFCVGPYDPDLKSAESLSKLPETVQHAAAGTPGPA